MNAAARIISILFHPLLMATYLYALLSWALPSALSPLHASSHPSFIGLIFIITFIFPLLNIGIFKALGTISSFAMPDRKERVIPFIFISGIYVIVTYFLYTQPRMDPNGNVLKLMMIIDLLVIAATIATFFFKVSVHSVGIWGLVGITTLLTKASEVNTLLYCTIGLIILAGLVMSSRLLVGAHTNREVMWGSVIGLFTSVSGMLIFF